MQLVKSLTFFGSLVIMCLICATHAHGQDAFYKPKQFPEKIPSQYVFNSLKEYNALMQRPVRGIKSIDYSRYAEEISYGKNESFTNGEIYFTWPELEDYLNKVLQKILPDSLKNRKNIHVYPTRNPVTNAVTLPDGSIFFHIGTLANIVNEAGLAIILGHELCHYLYQDGRNSYIASLKLQTKKNRDKNNLEIKIGHAHTNRRYESRCDSVGFILAQKAGYDIKYGLNNFYQFMEIENKYADEKNKKIVNVSADGKTTAKTTNIDSLLASHPGNLERITYLKKHINKSKTALKGADFLVDKKFFNSMQPQARIETMDLLLHQLKVITCAEQAFELYLLDPSNNQNIYYLLESVRRLILIKPNYRNKGFLTTRYSYLFPAGRGILHNLHLVIRDSTKYAALKAIELKDTTKIKFETYLEAFNYFGRLAQKRNIKECYLTLGLQADTSIVVKNEMLYEYLSFKDCKYPEYAKALLKNSLTNTSNDTKDLVLMDDINFREDHVYGYHNRMILSEKRSPEYFVALKSMMAKKFPNKQLVTIGELLNTDFKKAMEYKQTLGTALYLFEDGDNEEEEITPESGEGIAPERFEIVPEKKEQEKLFLIDPSFWYLFKNNNLKSLEILSVTAFDDKTKLTNLLNMLNPLYLYTIRYAFLEKYVSGSIRYLFKVEYYSFTPNAEERHHLYTSITKYKMYKGYFMNELYTAFKSRDKKSIKK
jgi:hypothetical protein